MPAIAASPPIQIVAQSQASSPSKNLTAEQAMENYRSMVTVARPLTTSCPEQSGDEIVVCGRRKAPGPRLPLPDERLADGEVAHHPSEPPSATQAFRGTGAPQSSRFMETAGKLIGFMKSAVTGEDPNP